jgi:arsenate reductase
MTAHWGVPDPAAVQGSDDEKRRAFRAAYAELHRRIALFTSLPLDKLKGLALKQKLDDIGRTQATRADRS